MYVIHCEKEEKEEEAVAEMEEAYGESEAKEEEGVVAEKYYDYK